MSVSVERDVRDRVTVSNEELTPREVTLHHIECSLASLAPFGEFGRVRLELAGERPETDDSDIGLVTLLLEEHPLHDLGSQKGIVGPIRRVLRQEEKDRVRLRECASILEDE